MEKLHEKDVTNKSVTGHSLTRFNLQVSMMKMRLLLCLVSLFGVLVSSENIINFNFAGLLSNGNGNGQEENGNALINFGFYLFNFL